MNFIFISPHFPHTYWQFCQWLSQNGVRVLPQRLGDSGHTATTIFMVKDLIKKLK